MNQEYLAIPESGKTLWPNNAQNAESSLKGFPLVKSGQSEQKNYLLSTVIKYKPLQKRIETQKKKKTRIAIYDSILIINTDK